MRKLKQEEIDLISFMLSDKPDFTYLVKVLPDLLIEEMVDGGMGSLRFDSKGGKKVMGQQIAAISLKDADEVPVSITVNLDQYGEIFELDVWKADFSPLIQFPVYPYIHDK